MTLLTANPSTVSREQVQRSDAVVLGRLVAAGRDEIRIERVLRGDLALDEVVTVLNRGDVTELAADRSYLFPLTRFRQDYVVTTLKGQHASPLIYPAAPETIVTAVEFLRDARN